jgi:hypothetical protein
MRHMSFYGEATIKLMIMVIIGILNIPDISLLLSLEFHDGMTVFPLGYWSIECGQSC